MRRLLLIGCMAALGSVLAGCFERPQTVTTRKVDATPWQGAENPYAVAGWKAGDQTSWNEQMRTRALAQNEYNKVK